MYVKHFHFLCRQSSIITPSPLFGDQKVLKILASLITTIRLTFPPSNHPSLSPSICLPFYTFFPHLPLSPLHADPGGVEDAHQSQHALQDVSDDIRGHSEWADLRQRFGLDVSNCTLCFIYQRLGGSNDKKREGCRGKEGISELGWQVWKR